MGETYQKTAKLFDLDDRDVVKADISFYLDWAAKCGGAVLELACGTGRVTIPLAEAGHEVWGLDLSEAMLARLREKLSPLPGEVRRRIHISRSDMTAFDLGRTFPLIIIPFRSFQALTEDRHQRDCLACVRRHLTPDGVLILDVFRPYGQVDQSWVRGEQLQWKTVDPDTGRRVRRADVRARLDLKKQVIYPELVYYVEQPDGSEERIVEPLAMKYYYEEQVRALLIEAGFAIEQEMGYYDGRPIFEGPVMIFVCKSCESSD